MSKKSKNSLTLILFFILLQVNVVAQNEREPELTTSFISGEWEFITTDPLGYIYAVRGDVIFKFNQKGDTLYQQSKKKYGDITSIDAAQSMRIMFFFEDQLSIGFTDNTLSWHQEPETLNTSKVPYPTVLCQSFYNNNLWVYDGSSLSLLKLDKNLEVIQRNENMPAMMRNSFVPVDMKERNDKLYVLDSTAGFYIFDLFGSLINFYEVKGATQIDIKDKKIYYLKNNELYAYQPLLSKQKPLKVTGMAKVRDFALLEKKVVILNDKGIYVIKQKDR